MSTKHGIGRRMLSWKAPYQRRHEHLYLLASQSLASGT